MSEPQKYACIVRRCRCCGVAINGPWGTEEEIWPVIVAITLGKSYTYKGEEILPLTRHQCSQPMTWGFLEPAYCQYSWVAPYMEKWPDEGQPLPSFNRPPDTVT